MTIPLFSPLAPPSWRNRTRRARLNLYYPISVRIQFDSRLNQIHLSKRKIKCEIQTDNGFLKSLRVWLVHMVINLRVHLRKSRNLRKDFKVGEPLKNSKFLIFSNFYRIFLLYTSSFSILVVFFGFRYSNSHPKNWNRNPLGPKFAGTWNQIASLWNFMTKSYDISLINFKFGAWWYKSYKL